MPTRNVNLTDELDRFVLSKAVFYRESESGIRVSRLLDLSMLLRPDQFAHDAE